MNRADYYILCKNGLVKIRGYVLDAQPLVWSDVWNEKHYIGIHKLNDGKWGLDDVNSGLDIAGHSYTTRKAALADYERRYRDRLYALWNTPEYKQQAWRFQQLLDKEVKK